MQYLKNKAYVNHDFIYLKLYPVYYYIYFQKNTMKYTIVTFVLLLFMSCSSDDDNGFKDYRAQNDKEIQDYITSNNLNAKKSSTGLYYVINEIGSGLQPKTTSDVTVAYKGYFTDGKVFDESTAAGIKFNLQSVIAGWAEGIINFKEGGSGILLIPSHLGYGNAGTQGIPGGSVLVFDVNLISVN